MNRRVYWWTEGCEGHPEGFENFGDALNPLILDLAHVKQYEWSPPADAEFVIAGSILEHLPRTGWTGTVCGAGQMHEKTRIDMRNANVLGVRGKLTLERLRMRPSKKRNVVLGDPALMVPAWIRQYQARWDVAIVPHWRDTELAKRYPHIRCIDVRRPPQQVVEEIAKCKRIIASSLHGIIVADAYGIPRQAELPPAAMEDFKHEGGDFKWRDYQSIYSDTDPHFGELWKAPHEEVHRIQHDLRVMMANAMGTTPPPVEPPPTDYGCRYGWRYTWPWHFDPQISILTPFRDDHEFRTHVWHWLRAYWQTHLQSVEIIEGHDVHTPFSKASAVNDAASRARGRVFIIMDADAYLDSHILQRYVNNIDDAVRAGKRLWYIPYSHLYRLSQPATEALIDTDPQEDYAISSPPPANILDESPLSSHDHNSVNYGHQYGALVSIMPREAFFMVGGLDPRFRGWGSEDVSFMNAVDTVYCQHQLGANDAMHLWHSRPGISWETRRWIGQPDLVANSRLAQRYNMAKSEIGWMRALTDEYAPPRDLKRHWWSRDPHPRPETDW